LAPFPKILNVAQSSVLEISEIGDSQRDVLFLQALMLKRPENASDPRANVLGKLHKALRHSALSTIISPSYGKPIKSCSQSHDS
jgi:hypothetical protein